MKRINSLTVILILFALVFVCPIDTFGQGKGKGKGGPPPWAPANGYRAKTRHIYFPEHNFYFDLQRNVYIYLSGDKWQVGVMLPTILAKVDLNVAVKVELELDSDTPQKFNSEHKEKYKPGGKNQQVKVKKSEYP